MTGSVFFETLRRKWRETLYWGIGLIIWAVYPFLLLPDQSGLAQYVDLIESLDPAVARAFGVGEPALFGTPEGFIGYAFFAYLLLIMGVYAVLAGLNFTATEEDSGILDMVVSLPLPRWQIIVEKMLAYVVLVTAIALLAFSGLIIGQAIAPVEVDINMGRFLEATLNIIPSTLVIMAVTVFFGVLVRRRIMATALAAGFVVISYILDVVGGLSDAAIAKTLAEFSVFEHFDGTHALLYGLQMGTVVMLFAVVIAFTAISVGLFQRRDLAV
ncbi:MAG: hypothetical protein OHK0046_29790 [Anaerolineae bacterium]